MLGFLPRLVVAWFGFAKEIGRAFWCCGCELSLLSRFECGSDWIGVSSWFPSCIIALILFTLSREFISSLVCGLLPVKSRFSGAPLV